MAKHTLKNIVEAATALFARRGAEGVTVVDIAKRCNIASGTVIYHFPMKAYAKKVRHSVPKHFSIELR